MTAATRHPHLAAALLACGSPSEQARLAPGGRMYEVAVACGGAVTTFPAQVSAGPPSLPPASTEAATEAVTEVIRSRGVTWSLSGGRMGSHAKPA